MMDMKVLGNRIKTMRCNARLSQGNVAMYLGVKQSLISMIEKGERNISSDMLQSLADLFCCPVETILDEHADTDVYQFAFRTKDIAEGDLKAVSVINRIALNQMEMDQLDRMQG